MVPVSSYAPTVKLTKSFEPTRVGHTFYGWSTTPTGDVKYKTDETVTLTGNLTLYAVWDNNPPYRLTLNPNYDGGVDKTIAVSSINPIYTLTSADEPTREGHTFYGWSKAPSDMTEYKTNDKITLTGDLTLYAVWDSPYEVDKIITIGSLNYKITNANPKQVELYGYEGETPTGTLNIPATVTIDGKEFSVTSIGKNAFDHCRNLTSVTISDGVTSIGDNAFYGCYDLTSVDIPNSVTNIGDYAFSTCPSLYAITFPNMVKSIGRCAFEYCGSLKSVDIPDSVTSIGDNAFANCGNLKSVTISDGVTSIGKHAFFYCYSLESVDINGNPKIGENAFLNTPVTVTMNLKASKVDGEYWTTFYNNGYNFQADNNTKVYKGTVDDSSLMLTEVEDKIVNKGTAVILKSSGNPVMTLTKTNSSDTNGNSLRGYSDRKSLANVMSDNNANIIYTLGNTSAGFGFHKYTGEYVPFNKAFLPLNTSNGAKPILNMVFANETTGINSLSSDDNALQNDWFSLDGTRLNGKPTQRGIYINGNKKVVVR